MNFELGASAAAPTTTPVPQLTPAQSAFFENKIRPLLTKNCYKCHSSESLKLKGELLLDTREGMLKGGTTGPAIVPGDPEKSLLIKAVRYTDPDLQMPPKGDKLSDEQINDLVTWVKMGAPDPRTVFTARFINPEFSSRYEANHLLHFLIGCSQLAAEPRNS